MKRLGLEGNGVRPRVRLALELEVQACLEPGGDDGFPPRHALDAKSERDRKDRRQAFRYGGDRKGNGGQEHLAEAVALDQDPERERQRRQSEDCPREPSRSPGTRNHPSSFIYSQI